MKPSNNIGLAGALVDNIVVESKNKFDFHPDKSALSKETDIVLHYIDPIENFNGWLVIDDAKYVLSAGGMRVQKGLSVERLKDMARNMTKKMRICGLPISGAKAGIDYDPNGAGKNDAICRFMGAIKPFLARRYSMGSDLNTTMDELNQVARKHQIRSIKIAIEVAQKYEPKYFDERISILNKPAIGDWTLGNIRGGYGVAMAAMRVIGHLGISHNDAVIAVQGFGVLAKASIVGLLNEGVKIKAVADIEKCIVARPGKWLPIEKWLKNKGTKLPDMVSNLDYEVLDKEKIYQVQCDVLMLEAIENAITEANVDSVNARSIVPGANLAVSDIAERTLYNRGVIVLPCFVAGSGGPMSMNGLFGHKDHPTTLQVLNYMKAKMGEIVDGVIKKGREESKPLTMAANELVFEMKMPIREYPYEV